MPSCTNTSPPVHPAFPLAGNDAIDSQLKQDRILAENTIKMLLLGARESGILKQTQISQGRRSLLFGIEAYR